MSMLASMFPPERSAQAGPSPATLPARSAATEAAPAPSTVSLQRSLTRRMAPAISASVTVTIASSRPSSRLRVSSPGCLTAMPSAIVLPRRRQPGERARTRAGLDADDAQLRAHLAQRERDPGREPAAADGHDDRLHLGPELLGELEAERALAGEDERVLEGVDVGLPRLDPLLRGGRRLVEAAAREDDLGAVALRRLELGGRRVLGHEDGGVHAGLARGPGDGLPVVAGARGDDAGGALGVRQAGDPVEGAADLEGAGALEVLGLQPDRAAGQAAEGLRGDDRRLARDALRGARAPPGSQRASGPSSRDL